MSIPHIALALAVTGLWGFSFVVMRELVDALPPLMVAGLRVAIAALPVLILFRPPAIRWYWTLGIGLTQGTIQMSLLFFAMEFGMPAGLSSLLLQSQVFFTTIFAYLILGEKPGRAQYAGIAVSGAGIAIIGLTLPGGPTLVGLGFVLVSALSWASSNMIVKLAGTDDLLRLIAWAHLIGIAPLLGLSYIFEGGAAAFIALADMTLVTIGELFFLGLIATCFGFMLWSYLLRRYPAYLVTPFSLVIPISGLISTALLLDETLGPQRLAGVGLVLIGLVLATLRFRARRVARL
ncbi:MAG: EamA family transporter [Rhodospirillaceae bacterium]|nr:EamA family transporter [Rhodospirillaceae bacterium]